MQIQIETKYTPDGMYTLISRGVYQDGRDENGEESDINWQAFMRFGAPRKQGRPLALGKFSLVQNAANLIKLAGREPKMAKGYAALTRKLVAEDLHIPSGIGDTELNKRLDLYCRKKQAKSEWSKITIYQRETDNNQDLMHAARELYEWRGDMTHDGK